MGEISSRICCRGSQSTCRHYLILIVKINLFFHSYVGASTNEVTFNKRQTFAGSTKNVPGAIHIVSHCQLQTYNKTKEVNSSILSVPGEEEKQLSFGLTVQQPQYCSFDTNYKNVTAHIIGNSDDHSEIISGIQVNVFDGVNEWPINNEIFEGKMAIFFRGNPNNLYNFGMEDNIHWELQLQGRFKRKTGPLYLSVELPKEVPLRLSWPVRAVANVFCKMIKFLGFDLHSSFGQNGELPHFATPLFQAIDKIAVTAHNEKMPQLGEVIYESNESIMERRKFKMSHTIDESLIYTMGFNDTFFDPVRWEVTGIPFPGFKRIEMKKVAKAIRLMIYEVAEENHKQHPAKNGNVRSVAHGAHTKRNAITWFQVHTHE